MRPNRSSTETRLAVRVVLSLVLFVSSAAVLRADTFLVFNVNDQADENPGDGFCDADADPAAITCTLRAAVEEASALPGADVIQLNAGTYVLTMGPLTVSGDLRIEGGVGRTIDGNLSDNIFVVPLGENSLELVHLELRNGSDSFGGCIWSRSDLTLDRVEIRDCTAAASGTNGGGGVFINGGFLRVVDSWIHDNDAPDGSGGGISSIVGGVHLERTTLSGNTAGRGGGMRADGGGVLINTTIFDNVTTEGGGGLWLNGTGAVYNSTIAYNACDWMNSTGANGGGILATTGGWSFTNTVIAGNRCRSFGAAEAQDCDGTIQSGGYNLLGTDDSCSGATGTGDQVGTTSDPLRPLLLGGLVANGGWSPTLPPRVGSPLIDAGNPAGCETDPDGPAGPLAVQPLLIDQRLSSRVGTGCDIGSVESGVIFTDGFERGDSTAWAAVAP